MNPLTLHISGGPSLYRSGIQAVLGQHVSNPVFVGAGGEPPDVTICILPVNLTLRQTVERKVDAFSGHPFMLIGDPIDLLQVKRAFKRGLMAYLLRTVTPEHLLIALTEALRGEHYVDPGLRDHWLRLQLRDRPRRGGHHIKLTRREREVLQLIVEEYTTDEIAVSLHISRCTVESHRANILGKLGVRNVAGLVREAMKHRLCTVA